MPRKPPRQPSLDTKTGPAPPKGPKSRTAGAAAKQARAVQAVELAIAGADGAEIGAALGISKSQANRVLRTEESTQIIVGLCNDRISQLSELFDRGLAAIGDAFGACTEVRVSEHSSSGGGPDHYARLAAHGHLVKTLVAGRPKPKPPEQVNERTTMTLQEIESRLNEPQEPQGPLATHATPASSTSTHSPTHSQDRRPQRAG